MNSAHMQAPLSPAQLQTMVHRIAGCQEEWLATVRYDPSQPLVPAAGVVRDV
jgi:hypothetical protein